MRNRPFRERLALALAGLEAGWRRERSFRSQARFAALALLVLIAPHPAAIWWGLIAVPVALVLALDLLAVGRGPVVPRRWGWLR